MAGLLALADENQYFYSELQLMCDLKGAAVLLVILAVFMLPLGPSGRADLYFLLSLSSPTYTCIFRFSRILLLYTHFDN